MWDAAGLLRDRDPLVRAVGLLAACEAALADQPPDRRRPTSIALPAS